MRCFRCLRACVVTPSARTTDTPLRMDRLQQMKSSGHGRYEEIVDEKEVIRVTAYVLRHALCGAVITSAAAETRSDVSSISSTPTSSGVRSWTSTSLYVSCRRPFTLCLIPDPGAGPRTEVLQHAFRPCVCRERPMACRTPRDQVSAMRDLFCRRSDEGPASDTLPCTLRALD